MPDEPVTPSPPRLVELPNDELGNLLGQVLQLTRGRPLRDGAAREAFAIVGDRVAQYFRENGYVVMRPAPKPKHSSATFGMRLPGQES